MCPDTRQLSFFRSNKVSSMIPGYSSSAATVTLSPSMSCGGGIEDLLERLKAVKEPRFITCVEYNFISDLQAIALGGERSLARFLQADDDRMVLSFARRQSVQPGKTAELLSKRV